VWLLCPLIAEALTKLRVKSVTMDGEGVVCRSDGVSDFDRLRAAVSWSQAAVREMRARGRQIDAKGARRE